MEFPDHMRNLLVRDSGYVGLRVARSERDDKIALVRVLRETGTELDLSIEEDKRHAEAAERSVAIEVSEAVPVRSLAVWSSKSFMHDGKPATTELDKLRSTADIAYVYPDREFRLSSMLHWIVDVDDRVKPVHKLLVSVVW